MKLLVAAIACHPTRGSEAYVGWTCVGALAKEYEVHVITHGMNQEGILEATGGSCSHNNLHFHFLREPTRWNPNRMIARFQDWREFGLWNAEARKLAVTLIREHQFDAAHHVTYATWRMASPLAGLRIPLVWGPVGGGETFPLALFGILSPPARLFELARIIANQVALRSPSLRRCAREATRIYANNHETRDLLIHLGAHPRKVRLLSQSFFSDERIAALRFEGEKASVESGLRLFAGGNLEGRKGVELVLRALVLLKGRGVRFEYTFGGRGPELETLQRRVVVLGLEKEVHLGTHFEGDAFRAEMHRAHVYLLPSLREGAPLTMIEAMLSGCVPLVAKCGGAAMLVDEAVGFAVEPRDPDVMVQDIANALELLYREPERLKRLSKASIERVAAVSTEKNYLEGVEG